MFSSLGFFKAVQCPNMSDCDLLNCFFSHKAIQGKEMELNLTSSATFDDLMVSSRPDSPPQKKRRLESPRPGPSAPPTKYDDTNGAGTPVKTESVAHQLRVSSPSAEVPPSSVEKVPQRSSHDQHAAAPKISTAIIGTRRSISPPPVKRGAERTHTSSNLSTNPVPTRVIKTEKLIPRPVSRDPVPFSQRLNILQKLHKQIAEANARLAKSTNEKCHKLTEQELIVQTLDEEQSAANKNSSVDGYKNVLAGRLMYYRKIDASQWDEMISKKWRQPELNVSATNTQCTTNLITTDLSEALELKILEHLKTPTVGLERHGYVNNKPSTEEIQSCDMTITASANWESCDRCGTRFQVFPGRNHEGQLTTRGKCTYHWSRPQRKRGGAETTYPCCSGSGGSEGCTEASTHVFKVADTARLASLLQFENTPENESDTYIYPAVTFDCEMGYTTHGMELVRLTAIAWPTNKTLLDILVRPFGEVLDFNTRFSGVTSDHFRRSVLYDSGSGPIDAMIDDSGVRLDSIQRVESPAEARRLLFQLIAPRTLLIGHAIENDLIACRILHDRIIDTALLFPHPKGLPIKFKLRDLAAKRLNRTIQAGGDEGHDSKEDSIATADLVKVKAKDKWQSMRLSGWRWEDDKLIPPQARL